MKIAKMLFKKVLRQAGIGVYNVRRYQRHTMAEVLAHLKALAFSPRTVIDVGVAYGTRDLYEAFPESEFLLIEPLAEYQSVLEKISGKYRAQYEIAAAGARPGRLEIHVHPDLSGSSLLKESEEGDVNGTPRVVPVVTLDEACGQRGLGGPYLLKIDTQGAELLVLEGAKKILPETEVIILEVSFFQFYQNGPLFHEVIGWMKEHGMVAYDMFGGQNRPLDRALAQVDMVFVKENGFLRALHHYATPAQRKAHTRTVSAENPRVR